MPLLSQFGLRLRARRDRVIIVNAVAVEDAEIRREFDQWLEPRVAEIAVGAAVGGFRVVAGAFAEEAVVEAAREDEIHRRRARRVGQRLEFSDRSALRRRWRGGAVRREDRAI